MKAHKPIIAKVTRSALFGLIFVLAGGCGSSSSSTTPPPPPPVTDITLGGVVSDGPVIGGTLFAFGSSQVLAALDSVDPDGDRLAALTVAASIVVLSRDESDADQFSLTLPGDAAGQAVFLIFDNTDAEDESFGDTPPNLESVVVLGDAGSSQTVNVSMHTTLVAALVRAQLDPDGDGTPIDAAAVATEIANSTPSVVSAFQMDSLGREIYPAGFDPFASDVADAVHGASGAVGFLLRSAALALDLEFEDALEALAGDAADGDIDGLIPTSLMPSPELEALAAEIGDIATAGADEGIDAFAVGPCSSSAVALRHACDMDVLDDVFELSAICADIQDEPARAECVAEIEADKTETEEECDDVFDARLALCASLNDAPHEPMFGPGFASNFVDPLDIGASVTINPWFPLVTGNRWVYQGDGETIEVVVTDETKLIDGITCVVIIDTASEDGVVVEETRDWHAQDVDGNVWYCGEISRNFEAFDGDNPNDPELVDIEGSWKAGRDGAEPGILLPFDPQVGDVIRQEVLFGEAEDAIEINSVTATETSPGGACEATCLMTTDFTPIEPDAAENKFYVPGLGLIVETNPDTGERVELVESTIN